MATPAAPSVSTSPVEGGVFVSVGGFSNISRIVIERSANGGAWVEIRNSTQAGLLVAPSTLTDFGPNNSFGLPSDTWRYRARVYDEVVEGGADISPYSAIASSSPLSIPQAGIPTGLTATPGNQSVTVSWTAGANNDGWEIQWEGGGLDGRFRYHTTSRSFRNLDNGTVYRFRVRGLRYEGYQNESDWTEWVSAAPVDTGPNLPDTPDNFTGAAGDGQIDLTWDNPGDSSITAYFLNYTNISQGGGTGFFEIPGSDANTTAHTITGLNNGSIYQIALYAVNATGNGGTATIQVTPNDSANPIPVTPTGFRLSTAQTSVTLAWNDPGDSSITRYEYSQNGGDWTPIPNSDDTTVSHTIDDLIFGDGHIFRIRAVNANGNGPPTQNRHIRVGFEFGGAVSPDAPAKPTGLSGASTAGVITLSWNDPSDTSIIHYEYLVDSGDWIIAAGTGAASTSHVVPGLPTDGTYDFRIRAVNDFGAGAASDPVTVSNPLPLRLLYALNSSPSPAAGLWALNADEIDRLTGGTGNLGGLIDSVVTDAIAYESEEKLWLCRSNDVYLIDPRDPDNNAPPYGNRFFNLSGVTFAGLDLEGTTALWVIESVGSGKGRVRKWQLTDLATPTGPFNISGLQGTHPFAAADTPAALAYQDSSTIWVITDRWNLYKINPADVTQNTSGYGIQGNFISHQINSNFAPRSVTLERDNVLLVGCSHNSPGSTPRESEYIIRLDCTSLDNTDGDFGFAGNFPETLLKIQGIALTARREIPPTDETEGAADVSSLIGTPEPRLVRLQWGAQASAVGYNLAYWPQGGDKWILIGGQIDGTTYTHGDLQPGTSYWYSFRPVYADGSTGDWSDYIEVRTLTLRTPSAPRSLVSDAQSDGVVLSWLAPNDDGGSSISSYDLWRWFEGVWTRVSDLILGDAQTFTDTADLEEGKWYWYQMRAANANGYGEWSETSAVIINPDLASAPRRLAADSQSTGVVLSWLAPADTGLGGAITGYNIWRWHAGVWTEIVADTGSTDTDYTDTASLTEGEWYWYAIRAINSAGGGEWSETSAALINPSLPSAPRRLVASETSSGVDLDWLAPLDTGLGGAITGYNIWRWDETNGWTEIVQDTGNTNTSYTDTGTLEPGWNWWAVRAINASGEGEWSETSGVTTATDAATPPTSLYAVEVATGVQLAWTTPASDGGSPVTGYAIWRSDGTTWTEIVSDTGNTDTEYLDTAVQALGDGIYFYRVQAITANGPGDFSAAAPVEVGAQATGTAEAPTGLVALLGANGAVDLSWVEPFSLGTGTHTGYQIECWTPDRLWFVCVEDTESTTTSYTLASPSASGVNIFRVAAITDAGVGEFSLPASVDVDRLGGPAGGRKTLGDTSVYAPTLILPPAVAYPVVLTSRKGYEVNLGDLYSAQPEWWSWSSQGGSDSAAVQVAVKNGGQAALRHTLDWLGHEVMILYPGSAHVLWSGYVNSVTIPVGEFGVRRSLEGYANDLRIQWTRPPADGQGAVDFVQSAQNPQAAWQQARFGVRSVLVQSDHTLVEIDQDDVDLLLDEYQDTLGSARMEQGTPSGARLECRGHAGILDLRYFPTRDAGQYGDVTVRDDDNLERIWYSAAHGGGDSRIYQYADLNPTEGHGPFSPDFDVYLRQVRFYNAARTESGSRRQKLRLGLFALGTGLQPGAELSASRVVVDDIGGAASLTIPYHLDADPDDPLLRLPAAGWYFGLETTEMLHHSGFLFNRATSRYWPTTRNSGRLLVRRETDGSFSSTLDHLCFDYFVGADAVGLAKWMASDAGLAQGVFGAHPLNAAGGAYGHQEAMYHEGDSTWRTAIDQLAAADRLCYAIDENRLLRFWSADGPDAEPIVWDGRGGANLGAFIGRRIAVGGESFLAMGASFDPMSGQVDFSSAGQPSATVAATRLGAL